jgi:Fis family transcriptional regulator, factor for inversion stimulation protein
VKAYNAGYVCPVQGELLAFFRSGGLTMIHAKVLVVDHDQGAYDVLKLGLAKHGYEMHATTTMANALALAGAHVYQAAFVSLALVPDRAVLDGLHTAIPDLPVILIHTPENVHHIPQQMLEVAANAIGKPLALGPVCLMLDRTMELASLRGQVRQYRQLWCLAQESVSESDAPTEAGEGTLVRLEEALVRRLRALMPSLELLGRGALHRAVLSYVEKLLLTVVLHECRGNQVKAALILGINRNTLRKKIHEFGLSFPHHDA